MNISSVNLGMSMPPPPPKNDTALTSDQESAISEILAEYDAENLSEADASTIVEAFSELGIQPGSGLESALEELGFDAKALEDLAGVGGEGGRPPPPPSGTEFSSDEIVIDDMMDFLAELVAEKLEDSDSPTTSSIEDPSELIKQAASSLSDDDKQSIYAQLVEKFGIPEGDSLIDIKV